MVHAAKDRHHLLGVLVERALLEGVALARCTQNSVGDWLTLAAEDDADQARNARLEQRLLAKIIDVQDFVNTHDGGKAKRNFLHIGQRDAHETTKFFELVGLGVLVVGGTTLDEVVGRESSVCLGAESPRKTMEDDDGVKLVTDLVPFVFEG